MGRPSDDDRPGRTDEATEARTAMVDRLLANGAIRTPAVETALRDVPRHHFVEHVSIDSAYADTAIATKTNRDGVAISSASQPTIVAVMLELAELRPGQRVLEIGAGTGYNAALMASIVGEAGRVVSVELEHDLARAARTRLADHGFAEAEVEVVTGDGAVGHAREAPYDRIVVTTGAAAIAEAWPEQLVDTGRLVVPVVGPNGVGEIHCLVKRGATLDEVATVPCGFLPMRSTARDGT